MTESTRTLQNLELVGGALCLDFVNTVNSRVITEHDYLTQYSDLAEWANKVGILSPAQNLQLQKRARQDKEEAESVLQAAQGLRDLLFRIFSHSARDAEPARKDVEQLTAAYGESISKSQLTKDGGFYQKTWKVHETLAALLSPITHSAGELLLSDELVHVKECPGCGWLFLDTSKNQSRRWCSMNTCGARDKMRRYHNKNRAK